MTERQKAPAKKAEAKKKPASPAEQASPAVQVAEAKAATEEAGGLHTLTTGVEVYLRPVATSLLTDAQALIEDPEVPVVENPDKGRSEPNPHDPRYRKALGEAAQRRTQAMIDVLVLFGVDLAHGVPDNGAPPEEGGGWLDKLKWLEELGHVSLERYDLRKALHLEFVYKRYVAVAAKDYELLTRICGLTPEAVAEAADSFQGDDQG